MKINFFGKNIEIPPQANKKKVLTGAGVFVAGMAAGMSNDKLPEIPRGPLDAEAGGKTEFKTTYEKPEMANVAFDFKKEETASDHGAFDEKENEDDSGNESGADNPDGSSEFKFVFNENAITKIEGDSLTLLGKKREVLDRKSPTELGLDANTPLKMKTGTKYKLVNALERIDDKDGKIKVWDGFPGKKIFCLVEIDLNAEGKFMLAEDEDDNLYAAKLDGEDLCWNRIIPEEEKVDDNGQLARAKKEVKPSKVEVKENYDSYKMIRKDTYENGDMILSFELYQGQHKVDFIGPIYLLKDRGVYTEVDSYAWESPDASTGRGRLLPTEMPVRDTGVRKFKNRDTGQVYTDALSIPKDASGKPLTGDALESALIAKHIY